MSMSSSGRMRSSQPETDHQWSKPGSKRGSTFMSEPPRPEHNPTDHASGGLAAARQMSEARSDRKDGLRDTVNDQMRETSNASHGTESVNILRRVCPRASAITATLTATWADAESRYTSTQRKSKRSPRASQLSDLEGMPKPSVHPSNTGTRY